jgi:hypothetical protein
VPLDRLDRYHEGIGDLPVGQTSRSEHGDLALSLGQGVGSLQGGTPRSGAGQTHLGQRPRRQRFRAAALGEIEAAPQWLPRRLAAARSPQRRAVVDEPPRTLQRGLRLLEMPTLIPRVLSTRAGTVLRHRQVEGLGELQELRVDAVDDRPFPLQVDGDYIGEFDSVRYGVVPGGLCVVA